MFDNLFQKIKNFDPFGWKADRRESVFQADTYDFADFDHAVQNVPPLAKAVDQYDKGADWELGNPSQDLFLAMLKKSPQFQDIKPGLAPLKSIIEQAMNMPEFDRLKRNSVGDPLCAGIGASALVEKMVNLIPEDAQEAAQEAAKAQNKADEEKEKAENLQSLAQAMSQNAEKLAEVQKILSQAKAAQEAAEDHAARAAEGFAHIMAQNKAEFEGNLNEAIGEAAQESKDKAEFIRQFSLAAGYNHQEIDMEVIQAALEIYNSHDFSNFADMIGYASNSANAALRQTLKGHNDQIRTRNSSLNPAKMANSEKLAAWGVTGQAARQDWEIRALSDRVRHVERDQGRKEEEANKGDFVIVRDDSGSTWGEIHTLFASVEFALLRVAKQEGRGFVSIPFSGYGQFHEWRPPQAKDVESLANHLKLAYGGGTEPYAPILRAFDVIDQESAKADIVIITDAAFGQASQDFLARLAELKEKADIRIYALVQGVSSDYKIEWADETFNIMSLADKNKTRQIFERTL